MVDGTRPRRVHALVDILKEGPQEGDMTLVPTLKLVFRILVSLGLLWFLTFVEYMLNRIKGFFHVSK